MRGEEGKVMKGTHTPSDPDCMAWPELFSPACLLLANVLFGARGHVMIDQSQGGADAGVRHFDMGMGNFERVTRPPTPNCQWN